MLTNCLLVGLGGFIGAVARYLVYLLARAYSPIPFPIATLIVNTVGCFIVGALSEIIEKHHPTHSSFILFASVGVLGGFTTFSAFGLESIAFFRSQQMGLAVLNILANLMLGLMAVLIGRWAFSNIF